MKFDYIVSLGFFCNVASELENRGYRSKSFPFDWVITSFESVFQLISNEFKDLLNIECLYRDKVYNHIVKNNIYRFDFYHDFKENDTIENQLNSIKNKYKKRINRLFSVMNKKRVLFVRYLIDDDSISDISNFNDLLNDKKNLKIIYIKNIDNNIIIPNHDSILDVLTVNKEDNESVSKHFFDDKIVYKQFKRNVKYSLIRRVANLFYLYKKKIYER